MLKGTTAGAISLGLAGCLGGNGDDTDGGNGDGTGDLPSSVKVPGIYDESGPTAFIGRALAPAGRDTFKYFNDNDTIPVDIDHPNQDYQYDVPQGQQAYSEYTSGSKPPIFMGFGTADTEALAPKANQDEIVYISASYSPNLANPEFGFNFMGNIDYTTQARCHLQWIKDNDPNAKVAFIYNNTPFGKAPVEGGRRAAQELGLDLGEDIILELAANSAVSQARKAQDAGIDYLIHQNITATHGVLLSDLADIYPEVTVCGLTYTTDERNISEAPENFEGHRYVNAFKTFQEAVESGGKGADIIKTNFEREGRNMDNPAIANLHYIRGVIHDTMAMKGLKHAIEAGNDITSGVDVREGMLEIEDDDMFGLSEPYTFQDGDRRPSMTGRLYEVQDGELEHDTNVELPRNDEWIGV